MRIIIVCLVLRQYNLGGVSKDCISEPINIMLLEYQHQWGKMRDLFRR